ncbi:MAG TPA: alpha-L-fucosidase [Verrucomicrobiae bacterium]
MNTKTKVITSLVALAGSTALAALSLPVAPGPFQPTMESLTNYHCPDWFRDAKFGIWAHWGPQAVPMDGDWYARHLYVQGNRQYKHHLENYGHPSTNGYKDIIPLWKAEKWDPDRLMALYKRAGAKYFVSMGSHHDNFYLWNSKLHKWNAVQMGPRRDVVADWQKAARRQGLKFGVSEHLGASFTWFQDSHKSDKTGPLAGVPYDGADPQYSDLYHFPAEPGDTAWYSTNPRWQQQWFDRIKELVDGYHPDLLYTDGGVPFGNEVGCSLIAHLYNTSAATHRGKTAVIYTCKQKSEGRWVEDLERGVMPGINPYPWQTDTSIGDWFYNRNWKFRPVSWTIHMLVDIVSKNGNLLLNIVQRPDGSLDPEVEQALREMADWIAIHGEAIYGTRPWLVYGEGAVKTKGGHFKEDFAYTAKDIRFTAKGRTLYATALGWPEDNRLLIRSLATPAGSGAVPVKKVSLVGYRGKVKWTQTSDGLIVELPTKRPSPYTCSLKISGNDLKPAPIPEPATTIEADSSGNYVLSAEAAEIHGDGVKTEERDNQTNLGFWDNPADFVSWEVNFSKTGKFTITTSVATVHPNAEAVVEVGKSTLAARLPNTGDWARFTPATFGQIDIQEPGIQTVRLRARDAASWKAINVRTIVLTRITD